MTHTVVTTVIIQDFVRMTETIDFNTEMTDLRGYYKQINLFAPVENIEKYLEFVKDRANSIIESCLREGKSLKYIGDMFENNMDCYAEALTKTFHKHTFDGLNMMILTADKQLEWIDDAMKILDNPDNLTAKQLSQIWFIGIAILLKLGRIQDDDSNGWLICPIAAQAAMAIEKLIEKEGVDAAVSKIKEIQVKLQGAK